MLHLAWRGVRHNVGRYVATLVAIITGVAFFTATGFLSNGVIDALEGDVDRQYGNIDVAVVVDDDEEAPGSDFAADLRISRDDVEEIAAVDGVAAAGGDLTGSVAFLADDGTTFADSATGRNWIVDEALNPIQVDEGAAPTAPGEIAVDRGTADDEDLALGEEVTVLTLAGPFDASIVGITKFGDTDALDQGGTVSIPEPTAFEWLSAGIPEYEDLFLRASIEPGELQTEIEPLVPSGFFVQTGDDFRADKRAEVGSFGQVLKNGLQGFAILALLVGGFVIYNTFSVIVAQRQRELAVLSAIGATPRQLKRSLRYEGLVVGLLGSALGVVVGLALGLLLLLVLGAFGIDLPGGGIKVTPGQVVAGVVLGTLITLLSVMSPARRAGRTEPIEALRAAAVETTTFSRRRKITTSVLVVLGAAGVLIGGNAAVIGLGALLLIVGVILAGPFIAMFGARVSRGTLSTAGLEGRLAVDNTARSPKRTAITANALLIGVFLVTLVSVAGTSVKDFVVGLINDLESADYVIESDGGTIDGQLVDDLLAVDDVVIVTPFRHETVTLEDAPSGLSTADIDALVEVAGVDTSEGSLDDLAPGKVAIVDNADSNATIGSTVTLTDSGGEMVDLEVVALIEESIDAFTLGNLVDTETFDAFVGDTAPTIAFIDVESGAQSDTEDAIEEVTALRPDVTLTPGNALGRLLGSVFTFLINAVNGLLLMSVIVALIGIVNTLSLSILERRRELGLLRVVGMTDRRVQRMVRLEAVLISALGTITGLVLGGFIGLGIIASIDRLTDAAIAFSIPWVLLFVVLVLGVLLGVLASLIPAKRSTRLDVLDALEAT